MQEKCPPATSDPASKSVRFEGWKAPVRCFLQSTTNVELTLILRPEVATAESLRGEMKRCAGFANVTISAIGSNGAVSMHMLDTFHQLSMLRECLQSVKLKKFPAQKFNSQQHHVSCLHCTYRPCKRSDSRKSTKWKLSCREMTQH